MRLQKERRTRTVDPLEGVHTEICFVYGRLVHQHWTGVMAVDVIARIDESGLYLPGPLIPIDTVHRLGILHRGVWLHIVSSDAKLLLVRRSMVMATCPGLLSIIGEHHSGRETDEDCAERALREEMPGLVNAFWNVDPELVRPRPRWFLFDYPGGVPRYDRCLISEFVARLPVNASTALAAIHRHHDHEHEHEASEVFFEPLATLWRRLRHEPERFCASELLPLALRDTLSDLDKGTLVEHTRRTQAMAEAFREARVVHGRAHGNPSRKVL